MVLKELPAANQRWLGGGMTLKKEDESLTKFRCDPCGSGTRCISCMWLVAFCHGFKDEIKLNDTLFNVPFKEPYIDMNENLRDGIILGDFISLTKILKVFLVQHTVLSQETVGFVKMFQSSTGLVNMYYQDLKASKDGTEKIGLLKLLLK